MNKESYWRNGVLWIYSEYYKGYIANYTPSHYLQLSMVAIEDD